MLKTDLRFTAFAIAVLSAACATPAFSRSAHAEDSLVGAWRGRVQFSGGAFVDLKDLEYMYAFAAGGTMTESSNYDAVPPVPPAYGVWKKTGPRQYEAKYEFYQTKAVSSADELIKGGGWQPDGYGTLTQRFTLSADGNSFDSKITLEMFDKSGKPAPGGGEATASGTRIHF